jgi:hypothetical protein
VISKNIRPGKGAGLPLKTPDLLKKLFSGNGIELDGMLPLALYIPIIFPGYMNVPDIPGIPRAVSKTGEIEKAPKTAPRAKGRNI